MKQTRLLPWAGTLAFSLMLSATQASTAVLDNTAGGTAIIPPANTSYMSTTRQVAKVFQTPAVSQWTLDAVRMALRFDGGSSSPQLTLGLYAVDANNYPTGGSLATTTTAVPLNTVPAYYDPIGLTGSGWNLAPGTTYALVANATSDTASLSWDTANNSYVTSSGFSFVKTAITLNGGLNWIPASTTWNALTLEVSPTAVPEPGSVAYSLVLLCGVGGYIIQRRRVRG